MSTQKSKKVKEVKGVEALASTKYLSLYKITYTDGSTWIVASRRQPNELMAVNAGCAVDTVTVIPIIRDKNGREYVMLTRERRDAVNEYIWSFPSGLVERGEDPENAVRRELQEETGASQLESIQQISPPCLKSEGMTDESVVMFKAVVTMVEEQDLQDNEDIDVMYIPIDEIPQALQEIEKNGETLSLIAAAYLPGLYNEHVLNERIRELEEQVAQLEGKDSNTTPSQPPHNK